MPVLLIVISVLSVLAATERGCPAQSLDPGTRIEFDIPPQPLDGALEAYTSASHQQVLYESALASGRQSTEVRGVYSQEAALRLLLSGTGLDFNYTELQAFTLVPATPNPQVGLKRQIADFNQFLGAVQTGVMAALCRRPETRPGPFAVAIQFRVGNSGRLENLTLLNSTGAAARDAAIAEALALVAFDDAPPADLPQPITMSLRAGPPSGRDECAGTRK